MYLCSVVRIVSRCVGVRRSLVILSYRQLSSIDVALSLGELLDDKIGDRVHLTPMFYLVFRSLSPPISH